MRRTVREPILVAAAAILLTIALTWPMAPRLASAGRVESGDARHGMWNVAWVAHAVSTNPWQLWNANIFYPHENALAYSEANLVAGVIGLPMWLATGNAVATFNWVVLVTFVLSGFVTYRLARYLQASPLGAAFAAIAYAYSPFSFAHLTHIQLLMTFGPPLCLLTMHRLIDAPSSKRGAALGLSLVTTALACAYYGVFSGLAVALGLLWFGLATRRRDWAYWKTVALAAAITVGLLAPFAPPYLGMRAEGFERSLADAIRFSANWQSYFASAAWPHRWMLPWLADWRDALFPGLAVILVAGWAVAMKLMTRRRVNVVTTRLIMGYYVALTLLALWASFGPNAGLYWVLHETLPVFSFLRAPARFGVLVLLGLSVLAGLGLAKLQLLFPAKRWLFIGILALEIGESTVVPLILTDAPRLETAYRRLASLPDGAVAEFPFFNHPMERSRHTEYMLASTLHWKPLINGYSDFIPPDYVEHIPAFASFPSMDAWRSLRKYQARYVIVHLRLYAPADRAHLVPALRQLRPYLRLILDDYDISLYEIIAWPEGTN